MQRFMIVLIVLASGSSVAFGTHLRGGQISIRQTNGFTCEITMTAYVNTASPVQFGNGILDFGDGQTFNSFVIEAVPFSNTITISSFTISHTYRTAGFYTVSYTEPNLNAGILNLTNSIETPLVLESAFNLDPLLTYSSPEFAFLPIFDFPLKRNFSFSTGAVDARHIYNYRIITPTGAQGFANPATLSIDPLTGMFTWDTRYLDQYFQGEFLIGVRVLEYDLDNHLLGWVDRLIDLIVEDDDSRIAFSGPTSTQSKIVVSENQTNTLKFILQDTTISDSVYWSSKWDASLNNNIQFSQYDSASSSRKMKIGVLTLHSTSSIFRDYPYLIVLRGTSVSDLHPSVDANVLFYTKDSQTTVVTGINPERELTLDAYPNPFGNALYLSGQVNPGAIASFRNIQGQELLRIPVDPQQPIDTSQLAIGFYVLEIADGGSRTKVKVVKK